MRPPLNVYISLMKHYPDFNTTFFLDLLLRKKEHIKPEVCKNSF